MYLSMQGEKKPVFVLDVDGVLLSWQSRVVDFCKSKGISDKKALDMLESEEFINPFHIEGISLDQAKEYMREYNASYHMENLKPYFDALQFVSDNASKYTFVLCTAMSQNKEDIKMRIKNLTEFFGNVFDSIFFCDTFANKKDLYREIYSRFGNPVAFVDDKPENIRDAYSIWGSKTELFLMCRGVRNCPEVPCKIVKDFNGVKI